MTYIIVSSNKINLAGILLLTLSFLVSSFLRSFDKCFIKFNSFDNLILSVCLIVVHV